MSKIFIFLNDCLLGENLTMELIFSFLKKRSWKEFFGAKNKKEFLYNQTELINFNNLFLRKEVLEWIGENRKLEEKLYIVSDFIQFPTHLLSLEGPLEVISYDQYKKEEKGKDSIIVCGEMTYLYKDLFKSKKTLFVGPYLLGKIASLLSVDRTEIISRPYGIFTIIWSYFFNFFSVLDVLWPLLFFFNSTVFSFWIKTYILSGVLSGIGSLYRHFLELEDERGYLAKGEETILGGDFIYLHLSTFVGVVLSLIFLFFIIIYGLLSFENFKALFYGVLYSVSYFLFLTRTFKEKILAKLITLFVLTTLVQPSWIIDFIKIKFSL